MGRCRRRRIGASVPGRLVGEHRHAGRVPPSRGARAISRRGLSYARRRRPGRHDRAVLLADLDESVQGFPPRADRRAGRPVQRGSRGRGEPMESNQARPTLVFFRHREEFTRRWPTLGVVEARRFSFVTYPLSGGFSRRPLVPSRLYGVFRVVERALDPLAALLAFRCLVVLERRPRLDGSVASASSDPVRDDPELPEGEGGHPHEQQPVAEAADVRRSVRSSVVPDGDVDDA